MTSAVSVDPHDLGASSGPPLGELLLSRGLITPEQLEQALADQRDSGRPLGEVFIRLGFTSGRIIAQALATQHGRMLKSEYGFATGFDAVLAKPTPRTTPASAVTAPRHLVFFPARGRGYVLLERPGPAPAVGDVVDTSGDGGSAVTYVTKVAQPPIPGPKLLCAYLV
jgi:hypothetical protein